MEGLVKREIPVSDFETKEETGPVAGESRFAMSPSVKGVENAISLNRRKKSAMSYVALISRAILASPNKRLTLSDIYQFIEKHFPEFVESRVGWKNTVRHNLSLHNCFIKGELAQNGKSCYWRVHPRYVNRFALGDFRRRPIRDLGNKGEETRNIFPTGTTPVRETAIEFERGSSHHTEENPALFTGLNFPSYTLPFFNPFQYNPLPQLGYRYAPYLRYMARMQSPCCGSTAKPRGNNICEGSCFNEFKSSATEPRLPESDCFKASAASYLRDAALRNSKVYQ